MDERRMDMNCVTRISKDANPVIPEYTYFLPWFMTKAQRGIALQQFNSYSLFDIKIQQKTEKHLWQSSIWERKLLLISCNSLLCFRETGN